MKFRVEATRTYTGTIDSNLIVGVWRSEFKEFQEGAGKALEGDALVEAFIRDCAEQVGGYELLDDFAASFDTDEDTSVTKIGS